MKIALAMLSLVMLTACTGKIYTVKSPSFDEDGKTRGVLFYGYKFVDKKVLLDRIRHPKTGDITHSMYVAPGAPDYCESRVSVERVPVADYSQPYAVYYKAALFESRKFGVTLDKGMLSGVNTEATPGPKVAVETLQGIASLREDILDGFKNESDKSLESALKSVQKGLPKPGSLACSHSQ